MWYILHDHLTHRRSKLFSCALRRRYVDRSACKLGAVASVVWGPGSPPTALHDSLPQIADNDETQMLVSPSDFDKTAANKGMLKAEDENYEAALEGGQEQCSLSVHIFGGLRF